MKNKNDGAEKAFGIMLFIIIWFFLLFLFLCTNLPYAIYGMIINPITEKNCNGYIDMNTSIWKCYD